MSGSDYDTKYLKVLDGIRALAIIIIVWFHLWQQSWLMPNFGFINLDFIPRYGFLLVDLMILISSFCLFIPYARVIVYKEKMPSTKEFYIKRMARIMPSYYLALIISVIFIIIAGNGFSSFFLKDTLMHIFFVNNWSTDTLLYTSYCGVLWTVALEVQFYIIFPFIAKSFVKRPVISYIVMMIIGLIGTYFVQQSINNINIGYYVNHFFTFISVYANGILASWFYVSYTKNKKRTKESDLFFMVVSIFTVILYCYLAKSIGVDNIQLWQVNNRLLLSFVFMVFIISTLLASKIYQKLFNNKFMKFIATISFNLYIYHFFIAIKLKEFRIPYYSGSTEPYLLGDKNWQITYFILCVVISIIVAVIITYLVEKPCAKLIRKKFKIKE